MPRGVVQRVIDLGICTETITRSDGTTETCNQIHQHCKGHCKNDRDPNPNGTGKDNVKGHRKGDPCGAQAMKGLLVCRYHGGGAPQSRAAGQRRQQEQLALGEVGRLRQRALTEVQGRTGVEQLIASIDDAAAMALSYRMLLDSLPERSEWSWVQPPQFGEGAPVRWVVVTAEGRVGPDDKGNQRLHVYEEAYRWWSAEHVRRLKVAADIGLEEKRLELHRDHVRRVTDVVRALVTGLGRQLDDPDVVPVVQKALELMRGDAT